MKSALVQFKRTYPRINLALPVEYSIHRSGTSKMTHTGNLGGGGLMLSLPAKAPMGSTLDLKIHLPDYKVIVCRARVVWIELLTGLEDADFRTGVEFLSITDQDLNLLRSFIRSQQNLGEPLRSSLIRYVTQDRRK